MNLDLLKKLTKLANHNPNDNEANSAARRVCKMLEEGNWNLIPTPNIPKQQTPPSQTGRTQTWDNIYRDIHRNSYKEPPYGKEPPRPEPKAEKSSPVGGTQYEPHKAQEEYYKKYTKVVYDESYPFSDINFDDLLKTAREKRGFDPSVKIKKTCSKCGKEKETSFIGPSFLFVCKDCVWE